MNLKEIRTQFVKISGRYDLVVDITDWADNGANYYIQAGQDMLERLIGTLPESEGRIWETLAIGGYYVSFQKRCRTIKEVWVNTSDKRYQLEKKDWEWLKGEYSGTISSSDNGSPLYYCPAKLREIDVTDKGATGVFYNYTTSSSKDYRGILIFPATDEQIDVEILGNFYQSALSTDADSNVFTILHPDTLIKAAVYQLELFYKDRYKLKGILDAISLDTLEIGKDLVEEEIQDITHIEG
jgi:hypothetical protein